MTGGGVGTPGPVFPWPFDPGWGFYYFCFLLAALATWMTANIASSRYGRALVAIRDAEVAAEASGVAKPQLLVLVFLLAGALGGVAGGLFASLQSYITPDAFTFEMSVLFFIGILIGGRGSILGPALGTIILTVLPEFAAPLVQWSTFLYAALLLVIVLVIPGGIADLLDYKNRRPLEQHREIVPRPELLARVLDRRSGGDVLTLRERRAELRRRARDRRARSRDPAGRGARPDRPQRQRQDDDAERHLRLLRAASGRGEDGRPPLPPARRTLRAALPHRPHLPDAAADRRRVGAENVMIGGTIDGQGSFAESLLTLPRHRARRGASARGGAAGAGGRRARIAGRGAGRPPAAQRTALRRDRARPDAAPGLS